MTARLAEEEAHLVDRLLREVATREPLSPEEERELGRQVAEGKEAARRLADPSLPEEERSRLEEAVRRAVRAKARLVDHNLGLVVRLARRYRWSGLPFLDLFQEGVLALLRAAERFDWRRGAPFSAYAAWWVRHALSRAVREARATVRLPDDLRTSLARLGEARAAAPTASWEELAERAGVDPEEAEHLTPLLGTPVPLQATVGEEGTVTLADLLADREAEERMEEVLVEADVGRLLREAERVLTPRERHVLERRYGLGGGEPRTLREVGDELGVSAQRVAQIESAALEKLRRALVG
ncbi:MAG TPA: RNA polymerase sigma factor RpoD/SigA [Actinomycetota bacterium]|nr:RNA polymerase sigma factor RpoD/SigA [Actinomycetota bacterium]